MRFNTDLAKPAFGGTKTEITGVGKNKDAVNKKRGLGMRLLAT
jgi:hypothetical protein